MSVITDDYRAPTEIQFTPVDLTHLCLWFVICLYNLSPCIFSGSASLPVSELELDEKGHRYWKRALDNTANATLSAILRWCGSIF